MAEKIKILFASDGLGNGGKERQMVETIKNLDVKKYEIGVITFNPNQHYEPVVNNISKYFQVLRKDKSIFEPFLTVFESFEKFKPDIVHTFDLLSSLYTYFPAKIFKSKIVNASIQDSGLDKGWQFKIKKYIISFSDLVISNSYKGLSYYSVNGKVLHNFIDAERFYLSNEKNEFNIAMVANFSDYKDYGSYFEVVKELIKYNLIDKAYAVGTGKYLNKYKSIIEEDILLKDKVIFTGNTDNIEKFLKSISIGFLFSTEEFSEGISNSVLEYMASGVVSIVSDIGASTEIIDNEIDGFLVNKYDINSIIEIIKKLKENKQHVHDIQEKAYKKVKDRFNLQKNLSKLERFYFDLINND